MDQCTDTTTRYWAVIPAAGVGSRCKGARAKQYTPLLGMPMISHTLRPFLAHAAIEKVVVVLHPEDQHWATLPESHSPKVITTLGGATRCDSIENGLDALSDLAAPNDWVLLHDAARPCIRSQAIERLLSTVGSHPVGGLLGVPVTDTLKRVNAAGEVTLTLPRETTWRAQTPQLCRYALLREAIAKAKAEAVILTDDVAALEHSGLKPLMVLGDVSNLKVTYPEDFAIAAQYLEAAAKVLACE